VIKATDEWPLEFAKLQSLPSLFRNNPTPLYLTLKFHDPDDNDYRWLRNLDLDTSDDQASWLELSCQAPYDDLCLLTELIDPEDHSNVWFEAYGNELSPTKSMQELVEYCP